MPRIRRYFRIIVICLCLLGSAYSQNNAQPIFEKIKALSTHDYPGVDKVVIFDSTIIDVQKSGLSYVNRHFLIKIMSPEGAKQMRTVKFNYDTLSAYIKIKAATIYKKDGRIIPISLDKVCDYPQPARMIYWGMREKIVPFGKLEVGDAVNVKLFRKGFTYALLYDETEERYIPPMKGHFYDIVPFWSNHPIKEKYYEVRMPPDKPLQYEIYNGELQSRILFDSLRTVYIWRKADIGPFIREPNMVAVSDEALKLLLSTAPDWESKSVWFYNVNEDYGSFEVTPEVQAKTEKIIAGADSDMQKISRLTHWVAENIRYSGLSMGPGEGYTLHKGSMTFRDRCGVCKDKAGMLVTMLRAAGFESYAAMTMAGSRIDRIPADQFNHSVTLVKLGGEYRLLDPTWVPGVRELWSSAEQQQQYLPGVPEGSSLKTTAISPPEEHYYRIRGEARLDETGTVRGKFILEAEKQSDARLRRVLRRNYRGSWRTFFEEMMYHVSPRAEILSLSYQDPYDLSLPMKITVEYRIPEYGLVTGNEIHFIPVVATYPFYNSTVNHHLFMDLSLEERNFGFRTTCSRLVEFEEEVKLPRGYDAVALPEYKKITGTGAAFQATYREKWNTLNFNEKLVLKKRRYAPEDWDSFRRAVKASKRVSKDMIILKK